MKRRPKPEADTLFSVRKRSISERRSAIIMAAQCRFYHTYAIGYNPFGDHLARWHQEGMDSGDKIAANLERIIAEKGTNNRAVAEAAGLGHTAVRDIIIRKVRNPTFATLLKLAEVLRVDVAEIVGIERETKKPVERIAVAGKVGAGAKVPLSDPYPKGEGLYHVECPPQLSPHGVVAVEVEGDSMVPMYQPGHVLFFSRNSHEGVLSEDVGFPCVVECEDGNAWVKLVKRGDEPGLFHLISLNPTAETMHNQRIKWAARVKLALPAEFVVKV